MRIRPWLVVVALVVIAVLVYVVPIFVKLKRFQAIADQVGTRDIDLSGVPDGSYLGSYDSGPVIVQVKVTVAGHKITSIDLLKHRTGQGQAAAAITDRVVEAQSIKVDAISGATMSSKVILLAIENALKVR